MTIAAATDAAAAETGAATRVSLTDISKQFAATQALAGVSLELRAGSVHALVGENGAGKSTLVKILAGVHQPDSGTIVVNGEPTVISGPAQARTLGIAVVHQEPRLFPDLSVAENVFIGHAPSGPLGTVDWRGTRRAAQALFEELDVRFDVRALVRGLSMADQQLIEIAKALSVDANVLILDEPTASLSAHEVERLFTIVRGLRDRGVAILFVSHRLGEVFDLCDTTTVFRDGRHVITTPTSELTTADLIRHMVGRTVTAVPQGRDRDRRRPARGRGPVARRRVRGHRVLGPRRRDRRDGGPRGRRADRGRPGAVRDRPARRRRGPARRQAGPVRAARPRR